MEPLSCIFFRYKRASDGISHPHELEALTICLDFLRPPTTPAGSLPLLRCPLSPSPWLFDFWSNLTWFLLILASSVDLELVLLNSPAQTCRSNFMRHLHSAKSQTKESLILLLALYTTFGPIRNASCDPHTTSST